MPSWLTGTGSVETGNDSALTATGVCAPLHPDFIKDGTSFLTGSESVLTATTPEPCGGPTPCATPGTVLYDSGVLPAIHEIASDLVGPFGAFEMTGIPFEDWGTCPLKLEISLDAKQNVQIPPSNFNAIFAFVSPPSDPSFNIDSLAQMFNFPPVHATNYGSLVLYDETTYAALINPFVIFNGPGVPFSIYFWPPVLPPDFAECEAMFFKNLRVVITAA